jgi:hypothetical protein
VIETSAQSLDDKTIKSSVTDCKCCLDMKRELEESQAELNSSQLISKLLQAGVQMNMSKMEG